MIRGQKVMLDSDLAELYGVTTGNLNLAVRRNSARFPDDFMLRLLPDEFGNLRLQIARSSWGYGGRRHMPFAFTEHGVAMLSSVLRSKRAVQTNIMIVRTFMRLRQIAQGQETLTRRMDGIESEQKKHHEILRVVVSEIDGLTKSVKRGFKRLSARKRKTAQIGFAATPKAKAQ